MSASHPIPARGETTPDTRPVRDGLDDSPILPFPPGFDPATRLPVEPAGTPKEAGCETGTVPVTVRSWPVMRVTLNREWTGCCSRCGKLVTCGDAMAGTNWHLRAIPSCGCVAPLHLWPASDAALTSEVSALREAVDADKARLDWLDARDSFDFEDFVTAWHQGLSVREAIDIARRDGAP